MAATVGRALRQAHRRDDRGSQKQGRAVIWVGLPAMRGTKSTSDMSYLDELYRERAEKAGIVYVDIWDGFKDRSMLGRMGRQNPRDKGSKDFRTDAGSLPLGVFLPVSCALTARSHSVRSLETLMRRA